MGFWCLVWSGKPALKNERPGVTTGPRMMKPSPANRKNHQDQRLPQMRPAFLRVTKAPFLLTVLRARQLSLTRTNLSSSGTQMRLT